jgi:glycine cleavage system H lipoate-binding protein/ABC-type phosphate transport system substrate-binding protein
MKTTVSLLISFLLLFAYCKADNGEVFNNKSSQQESIRIVCSPDLSPIASKWASEYSDLETGLTFDLVVADDKLINMNETNNLRFASSNELKPDDYEKSWQLLIGREVIVPVINSKNPFLNQLIENGISPEQFAMIVNNLENQKWETVFKNEQHLPIHLYITKEQSVMNGLARFLNITRIPENKLKIGDKAEIVAAIQNDPYAIGFCEIGDVMNAENQGLVENISLLPIDKNGNGKIDAVEDVYANTDILMRGVWIGKYPKALINKIYTVRNTQPVNENEAAFLTWVLTDGQSYLKEAGFAGLIDSEQQAQLEKLNPVSINLPPVNFVYSPAFIFLLIFGAVLALSIYVTAILGGFNKSDIQEIAGEFQLADFNEKTVIVPKGLYFDKTHTWAFMEKDGNVKVGIDDFMQHITGPITRVEMKKRGERVKKGDVLFTIIQYGKQLKIYAPVSGIIKERNELLDKQSSDINVSPYNNGWVYLIEPANWVKDIQLLQMAENYSQWLTSEFTRLKDFFASIVKPGSMEYAHIVLQDGGSLKDNILADFGPEVWEDFQTKYLDINN